MCGCCEKRYVSEIEQCCCAGLKSPVANTENISENTQYKYLHANPNYSGLEAEPIYDERNKRWVGLQKKNYDGNANYNDITQSAEMTVKHYSGKLDYVFLCRNDLRIVIIGIRNILMDENRMNL